MSTFEPTLLPALCGRPSWMAPKCMNISQVTRPEDIQNSLERRGLVSRLDQVRLTLQMFVDQAWTWYWSKYGVTHDIPADK